MIELDENIQLLEELKKRLKSIGDSLWLRKDEKANIWIRTKNDSKWFLEWSKNI